MNITVNERSELQLEDIFNTIVLKSRMEEIRICTRDGGFEIYYGDNRWTVRNGMIYSDDRHEKHENEALRIMEENLWKVRGLVGEDYALGYTEAIQHLLDRTK